jgi:SAM-dependent methyltransferase
MKFLDNLLDRVMHAPTASSRWLHNPPSIQILKRLEPNSKVLDVGCAGFRQQHIAKLNARADLQHYGIDNQAAVLGGLPDAFIFKICCLESEKLPFPDDHFDLVVACHVIEHIRDPINLMQECIRVCKPGGWISLEAPSERSLFLPGFPFSHKHGLSTSFYDDPTHVGRPWTTQSFFRLASGFNLQCIHASYDWNIFIMILAPILLPTLAVFKMGRLFQYVAWKATGWNTRLVARKPVDQIGLINYSYKLADFNLDRQK